MLNSKRLSQLSGVRIVSSRVVNCNCHLRWTTDNCQRDHSWKLRKKRTRLTAEVVPSEIERLKEEVRHEHAMYLRALADFDNYRRRVERERATAAASGKRDIILSSARGARWLRQRVSTAQGLRLHPCPRECRSLHRKLLRSARGPRGYAASRASARLLILNSMKPLARSRPTSMSSGAVVDEVQRGYRRGDEVLRPARVRVAV